MSSKIKDNTTVKRQLQFGIKSYRAAEVIMVQENDRQNLVTRSEKMHVQDVLPMLVDDGIDHRKGKVWVPTGITLSAAQEAARLTAETHYRKYIQTLN